MLLAIAQAHGSIEMIVDRVSLFGQRIEPQLLASGAIEFPVRIERVVFVFELEDMLANDFAIVRDKRSELSAN
jgi:hypothetical protein